MICSFLLTLKYYIIICMRLSCQVYFLKFLSRLFILGYINYFQILLSLFFYLWKVENPQYLSISGGLTESFFSPHFIMYIWNQGPGFSQIMADACSCMMIYLLDLIQCDTCL